MLQNQWLCPIPESGQVLKHYALRRPIPAGHSAHFCRRSTASSGCTTTCRRSSRTGASWKTAECRRCWQPTEGQGQHIHVLCSSVAGGASKVRHTASASACGWNLCQWPGPSACTAGSCGRSPSMTAAQSRLGVSMYMIRGVLFTETGQPPCAARGQVWVRR